MEKWLGWFGRNHRKPLGNHDVPGLVNIQKAIEHDHWNSEFSHEKRMVIFHSYVSLPEGIIGNYDNWYDIIGKNIYGYYRFIPTVQIMVMATFWQPQYPWAMESCHSIFTHFYDYDDYIGIQ